MSFIELTRVDFHSLASQILEGGHRVRFQAAGQSMQPFIQNGDILEAAPLGERRIKSMDVLLVEHGESMLLAHRVVNIRLRQGSVEYLLQGDSCQSPDGWFRRDQVLGHVDIIERDHQIIYFASHAQKWRARAWGFLGTYSSKFSWIPVWIRQIVRRWLFEY